MITPAYVVRMARHNTWQNRSIYGAADTLSDEARKQDRGAFFGSIHGTLNHLLWGDQIWMHRFAETGLPVAPTAGESPGMYPDWTELKAQRTAFDQTISDWAGTVTDDWLAQMLDWHSRAVGRDFTTPHGLLVTHMFNHQTHHRGQVHAMLTAAGAKPEDTDIPFIPDDA